MPSLISTIAAPGVLPFASVGSALIALSDAWIVVPVAVPPLNPRPSIAASTVGWSDVGGMRSVTLLSNVSSPTWRPGGKPSTKRFAASFAAARRFGATSVAAIELDVSTVRMIVPRSFATFTVRVGCANPTTRNSNAYSINAAEI